MVTHATFPKHRVFETELAGRTLKVEIGKVAGLANGAAMVYFGDTTVLCTATMAKAPRDGIDSSLWVLTTKSVCTLSAASPAPSCAARVVQARKPHWLPV